MAMAPGLAQIIVYEGTNFGDDMLDLMANDDVAKTLSSSWTYSPVDEMTEQFFQQFAAQGQSMFQASGDNWRLPDPNFVPPI